MKKRLILIIILLLLSSSVIFAGNNCLPSHRKSVSTTSTYEGRSFGGHYHIVTESVYCHDCKDVVSYKKVSEKFEGHSYEGKAKPFTFPAIDIKCDQHVCLQTEGKAGAGRFV